MSYYPPGAEQHLKQLELEAWSNEVEVCRIRDELKFCAKNSKQINLVQKEDSSYVSISPERLVLESLLEETEKLEEIVLALMTDEKAIGFDLLKELVFSATEKTAQWLIDTKAPI